MQNSNTFRTRQPTHLKTFLVTMVTRSEAGVCTRVHDLCESKPPPLQIKSLVLYKGTCRKGRRNRRNNYRFWMWEPQWQSIALPWKQTLTRNSQSSKTPPNMRAKSTLMRMNLTKSTGLVLKLATSTKSRSPHFDFWRPLKCSPWSWAPLSTITATLCSISYKSM